MSLDPIRDELMKKAANLSFNTLAAEMEQIKQIIVNHTRIGVRMLAVKNQVIKIAVEQAPAASEIHLQRHDLLEAINQATNGHYTRLIVVTR